MPTTRTRRVRKIQAEPWKQEYLLYGRVLRQDGGNSCRPYLWRREYQGPFCNQVPLAWKELRDKLLPQWIREYPGSRPWSWWQIDAPEERQPDETELNFLRRHNLLEPGEAARVGDGE